MRKKLSEKELEESFGLDDFEDEPTLVILRFDGSDDAYWRSRDKDSENDLDFPEMSDLLLATILLP